MSSDEMDAFRAELLRQKIIFEAELRRQRDTFEEQLSRMAQELADREADCRNLQAVVTILGKKVDSLLERRVATPQRRPSPSRSTSSPPGDNNNGPREAGSARNIPPLRVPSPSTRRSSPFRRNTNNNSSSSARLAPTGSLFHGQSISSVGGSCHNSPARHPSLNGHRPKLGQENIPDHCLLRRTSGARSQKLKTGED
ncbi:hypothetical protein LSM04_007613 [Trypanosoma melophagium]|uniref:uncharacterized protein n=1 Tax=Trypanosoma melophagium TaxID=715481 RepID=UPI00351A6E0F|nr:hypothetical protein LSM04_007613 [Trypanosoma melophagium]